MHPFQYKRKLRFNTWKHNITPCKQQKGAYWVTVDGERIPRHIIKEAYDESETGWYYNMSDRTILVKYPLPKKADYEVVISTEKFDLIGMNEDWA